MSNPAPHSAPRSQANLRVLISADRIAQRVAEIGQQIDEDFPGDGPIYLIGILKGSFIFMADLARAIRRSARIEFMGVSSYGREKSSSGEVQLLKDLDVSIAGADVVIVEDIVDSGITLTYLHSLLEARQPRTLRIATLLDKPERRVKPVKVDYVGFQIPDEFVVGYGLDYAEDYRNLGEVCILE